MAQGLQLPFGAGPTDDRAEVEQADLVARAAGGDDVAFALLYQQEVDTIYRYLVFKVGDPGAAEDLTSEVFVRAWQALPRYQDRRQPLRHWLLRIARNLAVDHFRRMAADRAVRDELGRAVHTTAAPAVGARDELEAALRALPPTQREVIVLRFLEDLPTGEVARIVGKSEGAVRVIQHRALQALRSLLAVADWRRGA